jgi:Flp pilus assembly protein CpaB
LRRTSRLLVVFGIALAVLVFVLILAFGGNFGSGPGPGGATPTPTPVVNVSVVEAAVDIPLGTQITGDMLTSVTVTADKAAKDGFTDPSLVIGQVARRTILTGAQLRAADFALDQTVKDVTPLLPPGMRAVAVTIGELTGVGKLIHVGDTVDVVLTFDENAIKVVTLNPPAKSPYSHDDGLRPVTVKAPLLLQDIQVIGTIDSPPVSTGTSSNQGAQASAPPATNYLTGTTKLIILAVTDAQAEAIVFARTTGTIDLILRSPGDAGTTASTDGVVLKTMFDTYGVLPPYLIKQIDAYVPDQP